MSYSSIKSPFTLPCGVTIPNRLVKSAMTERLSNNSGKVNNLHVNLYRKWASSGSGLLITGNIMVDKRYREAAGNVVADLQNGVEHLKRMAEAGKSKGNHIWAQLSHSGRQTTRFVNPYPVAPSGIRVKKLGLFAKPKALTIQEIEEIKSKFIQSALLCRDAGFTGIQIHAAHGYLINQFLSPHTNQRTDRYGGIIENRSRLLLDIIRECRKELGSSFPIGVKINSADFQRGGFDENDSLFVIQKLENLGIDLLEVSGGTYENIAFFQENKKDSTRQREAFFMDFARKIRKESKLPIMITGGFRTLPYCASVIDKNELDFIGLARPFLLDENFPKSWLDNNPKPVIPVKLNMSMKKLMDFAIAGFYDYQIHQLAKDKPLKPGYSPYLATLRLTWNELRKGRFGLAL